MRHQPQGGAASCHPAVQAQGGEASCHPAVQAQGGAASCRPVVQEQSTCLTLAAFICVFLLSPFAHAQTSEFDQQASAYRTALHYDPTLTQPLEQLVELYQTQNRLPELVGIYQAHVAQYPNDANARSVLLRILSVTQDPRTSSLVRQAAEIHAADPWIRYLLFQQQRAEGDPAALSTLAHAIDLHAAAENQNPNRQRDWILTLLTEAEITGEPELARKHISTLYDLVSTGSRDQILTAIQQISDAGFAPEALQLLQRPSTQAGNPETQVDEAILNAKLEAATGHPDKAISRLQQLVQTVAPDYHRRAEIIRLQWTLAETDSRRSQILTAAETLREEKPDAPENTLDFATFLEAAGRTREAANLLTAASHRLTHSAPLEQAALQTLNRQNNPEHTAQFLQKRLQQQPERHDLRSQLARLEFLRGNDQAALTELEKTLANLPAESATQERIQLARDLQLHNHPKSAIQILKPLTNTESGDIALLQQIAQLHLELEDRNAARAILTNLPTDSTSAAEFENLLQFLTTHEFFQLAETHLKTRLQSTPQDFDLQLQFALLSSRQNKAEISRNALQTARELADTLPRYRHWLETGFQIHSDSGRSAEFFQNEIEAILPDPQKTWNLDQTQRLLTLCEIAQLNNLRERVANLAKTQLQAEIPDELRIQLRLLLVQALETDPAWVLEVETQLKSLLAEDTLNRNNHTLRLAALYHRSNRPDLAHQMLAQLDLVNVTDSAILSQSWKSLQELNRPDLAVTALRRLTRLQPENRPNWEALLNLQAASSEEPEFRQTIRRVLAASASLELAPASIHSLKSHLADSHWRSIAAELNQLSEPELKARIAALREELYQPEDLAWLRWLETRETETAFPDGLVAVGKAPAISSQSSTNLAAVPERHQWAWETPGTTITSIQPAGDFLLIQDHRQTISAVDARTGKQIWELPGNPPARQPVPETPSQANGITIQSTGSIVINGTLTPQTIFQNAPTEVAAQHPGSLAVGQSTFLRRNGADLECRSAQNAEILWKSTFEIAAPEFVSIRGDRVLTHSPERSETCAFSLKTGKILWKRSFESSPPTLPALSHGAVFSNERILIHGAENLILNAATGETLWEFRQDELNRFPLRLRNADEAVAMDFEPLPDAGFLGWDSNSPFHPDKSTTLVAPAVEWAKSSTRSEGIPHHAALHENWLVLMSGREIQIHDLNLPLAGKRVNLDGTWIGAQANSAAILTNAGLSLLNLANGEIRTLPLNLSGRIDATLRGNQVLLATQAGIVAHNIHSGRRIWETGWSTEFVQWATPHQPLTQPENASRTWEGLSYDSEFGTTSARVCYPIRTVASETQLFVLLNDTTIAAFGEPASVASHNP